MPLIGREQEKTTAISLPQRSDSRFKRGKGENAKPSCPKGRKERREGRLAGGEDCSHGTLLLGFIRKKGEGGGKKRDPANLPA